MGMLITDSEAAEMLRMTVRQLARLARRRELPSIHLPNGDLRFDVEDLQQWINSLKQPVQPAEAAT